MDRYQYLLLMGACVLITLPLELVLGARVWRRPRRLATALLPAAALFVGWDIWASATGTWSFNERYTVGQPDRGLPRRAGQPELTATFGFWVSVTAASRCMRPKL